MSLAPLEMLPKHWSSEWVSLSESEFMHGPLRETPASAEALHLPQPQPPLIFTAGSYRDFSSQHWHSGLWSRVWGWDSLLLRVVGPGVGQCSATKISLPSLSHHHGCGPGLFWTSSPPTSHNMSSSVQFSLSYRSSVQLVFRWFSRAVVL